ncbi:MAG: tryptophan--tRNA ligase [Nocardioidaceae bacterium]
MTSTTGTANIAPIPLITSKSTPATTPTVVANLADLPDSSGRVLSGITPSGPLTLGNYLGALKRFVDGQRCAVGERPLKGSQRVDEQEVVERPTHGTQRTQEGFFFVADLHAMTTPHEPTRLHELTMQTAALFFAAGLDPERSTVFVQSQVHAHVELGYLLECTAHIGELGRMIQFKEKGSRPGARGSLFTYPCLMAADILLYDAETVPVGGDQDQHVELCRDLAIRFNRLYGDTFRVPRLGRAALAARVADLADPTVKMSKSAPDAAPGVIRMLDDPAVIARKINRAVTDSEKQVRYGPLRKPGVSNLLDIIACIAGGDPAELAAGISSYGELKRHCIDRVIDALEPIQGRYAELTRDPAELDAMLARGAERASAQADPVVARAKRAVGLRAS